jgi:Sulfotransferase domain
MKPDFIGIGAQKCATTWLHQILSEHPDVFMAKGPQEKDTRFFSHHFDNGFEWYENHYQSRKNEKIAGEYSTSYFSDSDAPNRIHGYNKNIKLLLCLRNPIERAYSQHKHSIRLGFVSEDNLIFKNALKNNPTYISQSLYYSQLSRWLTFFDQSQILIILYDEIQNNPKNVKKKLYSFLNIDSSFNPKSLGLYINKSFNYKNKSINRFKVITKKALQKAGLNILLILAKKLRLTAFFNNYNTKTTDNHSDTCRSMELEMHHMFQEDINKLSVLIHKDLTSWCNF